MRAPVAVAELVADQPVARLVVRDAQKRLGKAHQRHALGRREGEFLHQRFDAEGVTALGPHFRDKVVS